MKRLIQIAAITLLFGCEAPSMICKDPNAKATYGDTGLPKNCRAIIQNNINAYRSSSMSADYVMQSIERNCGSDGWSWGE